MKSNLDSKYLDEILLNSEFKEQVDLLGKDLFLLLLDFYNESKIDPRIMELFPHEKKRDFELVSHELSKIDHRERKVFHDYLNNSNDKAVRNLLGECYRSIMYKKEKLLESSGYDSLYKFFINAQANDSIIESEGDSFFYIGNKRYTGKGKNSELIWVFAKSVEFLYETTFR